ncbi:MAG: DegV family protein [Acidimicrobiales bacterium]
MTVAVVVDGAASLPAELAEAHGIAVVPMGLVLGDRVVPDDTVSGDELLALVAEGEVSTSGPSPGDFASVIERALERADEVLVLTLAAGMSSTHDSAELAARLSSAPVRVVDTGSAAGGEGLVALAAARRAAEGASIDEVESVARRVIGRIHLVATVDDLGHLVRSGRVPALAGRAADTLHVRPLFEFRGGEAHVIAPAVGVQAARRRIVERCLAGRPGSGTPRLHVAALDAQATDRARALLDDVLAEVPDAEWFIGSFGPVMLVHVGRGVSGLAWWWDDDVPAGSPDVPAAGS